MNCNDCPKIFSGKCQGCGVHQEELKEFRRASEKIELLITGMFHEFRLITGGEAYGCK